MVEHLFDNGTALLNGSEIQTCFSSTIAFGMNKFFRVIPQLYHTEKKRGEVAIITA
jgi:hypothetical protein